jgi:pyrimidine-specific ribonucleoside hydrolase
MKLNHKIPVIIDCDPGLDDTLMLMLAFGSGNFDVKAVTTSAGNQTQDATFANALNLLSYIGVEANVFRGSDKPLIGQLMIFEEVHGAYGFGGVKLPPAELRTNELSAIEAIAEILKREKDKITIVVTGPLTNIAAFLLTYPYLKERIERISIMGGGIFRGNVTPKAEFNIYVDPEAASIVFKSGIPITMCGLDVTHKALIFDEDINTLRNIGNKSGELAAKLMEHYLVFYKKNRPELEGGAALHDPCAIAWLIDPTLFSSKECFVDIEISGALTRGTTVVDFYNTLNEKPNATVAYELDRSRFLEMLFNAIRGLL